MDWRDAVLRWHRDNADPVVTRQQLETVLNGRFKSAKQIADTLDRFDAYVDHYQASGLKNQRVRMDVEVPLPNSVGPLEVSGEVARFDRRRDFRYLGCMLMKDPVNIADELRLPLVQYALMESLNLEADEVHVGVYAFSDNSFNATNFTDTEIDAARSELENLLVGVRVFLGI